MANSCNKACDESVERLKNHQCVNEDQVKLKRGEKCPNHGEMIALQGILAVISGDTKNGHHLNFNNCGQKLDSGSKFMVSVGSGKKVEISCKENEQIERRHFFGLCPVCLTVGNHNSCSGCLLVSYCSKECQKKDWKQHKTLCKIITQLRGQKVHLFDRDPSGHGQITNALKACLKRNLTQYESDLLVHPRLCFVCLNGDQAKLNNCPNCHCVAYCSDQNCRKEDAKLHSTVCHTLSEVIKDHKNEVTKGHKIGGYMAPELKDYQRLPNDFESLLKPQLRELLDNSIDEDYFDCEFRKLSMNLTCPATVLFSAEQTISLDERESLTIHIVGARKAEVDMSRFWTLIPTRIPSLRKLNLMLIGPELENAFDFSSFSYKTSRCEITYRLEKLSYHKYVSSKNLLEPDLVAALNCGFIFYKDWDSSLDHLVRKSGAPLVFTEYYQEDCALNLQKLEKHCKKPLDVIMNCEPNPFCSRYAARIPAGFSLRKFNRKNVLMSNDFICIVKRK